jgi:NhaP-type Na+/H+ and K+/H+ antiporter
MPEKDPTSYQLLTYLWVMVLAAWGGIASYIRRVRSGAAEKFSFMELIGEIVISGFTGVLTFWLCELAGFPGLLTAAFVGISGHMGSRAIALMEDSFKRKMGVR